MRLCDKRFNFIAEITFHPYVDFEKNATQLECRGFIVLLIYEILTRARGKDKGKLHKLAVLDLFS